MTIPPDVLKNMSPDMLAQVRLAQAQQSDHSSLAARPPSFDLNHSPFIVIWEITRTCDLVCQHCRAEAFTHSDPRELKTDEAKKLLLHIREEFGPILMVFTGGDPLKRADVFELIAYGHEIGLRMTITPSATPLLTTDVIDKLKDLGIQRMAVSLDGSDAATHDAFRGFEGTFDRTCAMLKYANEIGMETQINSSINKDNQHQLEGMAAIGAWHDITLWSVFIMVPTGRAEANSLMSAGEHEKVYRKLAHMALDQDTTFDIKTTAGQPYYRVKKQLEDKLKAADKPHRKSSLRAAGKINDGKGFVFISHIGDINPSGFLPINCGNVRDHQLADVYRNHEVFKGLRDPSQYAGKCGVCTYNDICGGSRSRSFGLEGHHLASDPTCPYVPTGYKKEKQPHTRVNISAQIS